MKNTLLKNLKKFYEMYFLRHRSDVVFVWLCA